MRHALTIALLVSNLMTIAQDKSFIGTYSDTLSTHKIYLTLQDTGEFQTDEVMSEGRRNLIGNWIFHNSLLTLRTTKIWAWDNKRPNEKLEFTPNDFHEMLVTIGENGRLTVFPHNIKKEEDGYFEIILQKVK